VEEMAYGERKYNLEDRLIGFAARIAEVVEALPARQATT
jgi:hypothetical protein